MTWFIDRRLNGKNKSTVNRQRFLRRYKSQIKQSISEAINKRSVTDVDSGESVSIPTDDISEPMFHQGRGGLRHRVHPGNEQFVQNDRIERPQGGGGGSGSGQGQASQDGEGQDEFVFQILQGSISRSVVRSFTLPNLKQNQQRQLTRYKRKVLAANGVPANSAWCDPCQNWLARTTTAMTSQGKRRELHALKRIWKPSRRRTTQLLEEERLRKEITTPAKIERVHIDTLIYATRIMKNAPTLQPGGNVLPDGRFWFNGSLRTKDMAKRFYILLYLFLSRTYKNVEVVYIATIPRRKKWMSMSSSTLQETGGTIVSSALKLMDEVVKERYNPAQWNIYAAQASDGDNWADDSPLCHEILAKKLLPVVRYCSYIEITRRAHQTLWREYEAAQSTFDNFAMQHIRDRIIYRYSANCFIKQSPTSNS